MAISTSLLTANGDTNNQTAYTTASVSPGSGVCLVAMIVASHGNSPEVPSLSGLGLTWTSRVNVGFRSVAAPERRLSLFTASGNPSSGQITISFSAQHTGALWAILECTGVDLATNDGVVQSASASGNNVTTLTPALASFGHADNRPIAAFSIELNSTTAITPGTGYSEFTEVAHGLPAANLSAIWHPSSADANPNASWSARDAGAVSIELKAAQAGGEVARIRRLLMGMGL